MKLLQRIFWGLIFLGLILGLLWVSPYSFLLKGVRLTYCMGEKSAHYLDWKYFDTRAIPNNPNHISQWPVDSNRLNVRLSNILMAKLENTHSGSFLVYHNDTLVCEKYFAPLFAEEPSNSFSMAKTIVTIMVQQAIQRGELTSWDQKVNNILPWLKGPYSNKLTLRHLSTMSAGLDWKENYYLPIGVTAKTYYGSDVGGVLRSIPIVEEPGKRFVYQSGATQLLAMALMEATGKHLSELASEYLWIPMGAEASATWQLDKKEGQELAFCCFDARARDFGRLGLLVLHQGMGLVDSAFLVKAQRPFLSPNYGHSFWIGKTDGGIEFSYFQGLHGQFICILPKYNMVVVRTGHGIDRGRSGSKVFDCVKTYIEEAVKQFASK